MIRAIRRRQCIAIHGLHPWTMITGLLLVPQFANAADDDVLEADLPQINLQIQVNELTFDQWTYGTDALNGQKAIDDEIKKVVRAFAKQNHLTEDQIEKLMLAARVDKQRHVREIEDLRVEFDQARSNLAELKRIALKANQIRGRQANLLGTNSFFMKSRHKILMGTDSQSKTDKWHLRHKANIDSAIRAVERSVLLRDPQKHSLTEFLLDRIPVSYTDTGYEDLLVGYQFASLFRANLKSQFDEDQWPKVVDVLDAFLDYESILKNNGLIDRAGRVIHSKATRPSAPEPAPTSVPGLVPTPNDVGAVNGNVTIIFKRREQVLAPLAPGIAAQRFPVMPVSMPDRHRANAESAVRLLGRKLKLGEEIQRTLVGMLLDEVSAPREFGNFDDLMLQYRLSQMSEDRLKPLFAADAWPQVKTALSQMSEVAEILEKQGLLPKSDGPSEKSDDDRRIPNHQRKDF